MTRVVEGPVTEAGRALLAAWQERLAWSERPIEMGPRIVAIEAAARAEVIAEIREGVEGLPRYAPDFDGHMLDASDGWWLLRRDLLEFLLPPTEPK